VTIYNYLQSPFQLIFDIFLFHYDFQTLEIVGLVFVLVMNIIIIYKVLKYGK
jgi:hypothetical protein